MIKMTLSFELRHEGEWFYVGQHVQVNANHYTWALVGAGSTEHDAWLSARLFMEGAIETLDKDRRHTIS